MTRTDGNITQYSYVEIEEETYKDGEFTRYWIEENGEKITLSNTAMELIKRPMIITIKDEMFIVYFDPQTQRMYIQPKYTDPRARPRYQGLTNRVINKLTNFVHWNNYRIFVHYYDYEDCILCIQECQSNINPQDLTDHEMDYLCKKLIKHMNNPEHLKQILNELNKEDDIK